MRTRSFTRQVFKTVAVVLSALFLLTIISACSPYLSGAKDRFPIDHDNNENKVVHQYPEHSDERRNAVIDRAIGAMDNLLVHLDSIETSETGYSIGAEIFINTYDDIPAERSAFKLNLRANLYTYPYEETDADGNIIMEYRKRDGKPLLPGQLLPGNMYRDEYGELVKAQERPMVNQAALKKHNELIKYNDIILEWYDAVNNQLMIGFYFDGINPNSADPGNNLYLNLLGDKRKFENFGDTVLYQQIVRLITKFNLNTLVGGVSGGDNSTVDDISTLLRLFVSTNYKETINDDVTSLYFHDVDLFYIVDDITTYMRSFFAPFEDKLDPLSNKYLGFRLSTLGTAQIASLATDMRFLVSTPRQAVGEILTGLELDLRGVSRVMKGTIQDTVDFTSQMKFEYNLRVSTDIRIENKQEYKLYEHGQYEFTADLYVPFIDLRADGLLRTDVNSYDNSKNRVFMEFYDKTNNEVLIGAYYTNELTYLNITNLQALYGGIKFEDINLPKAYRGGFNLSDLLKFVGDFLDEYIVLFVDNLLYNDDDESYANLTKTIMDNMESTMIDPDVPESRNTIRLRLNMELLRAVMKEMSDDGTEYTNDQMVGMLNEMFGIDIETIAALMGVNVKTLMDSIYFDITYDVDEYTIKIEVFTKETNPQGDLMLRLILTPIKMGESVVISFPSFEGFLPLLPIRTYSGNIEGQILFASTEEVDLSALLGAFVGDLSGLNTHYILPAEAKIAFTAGYDQYIRDQILENGRWTRAGRSAFAVSFFAVDASNNRTEIIRLYANDVRFDTSAPVEEFGYVWVDLICVPNFPRVKIREDLFMQSLYLYLNPDGVLLDDMNLTVGLTTVMNVLMEDSWVSFEPDVMRITTSNQLFKDFFRVDELIATVELQLGFKQRVRNIDEFEHQFAMYTVGHFSDIQGNSPYSIRLHPTIPVYFDFGNRIELRDFFVLYHPNSVEVLPGKGQADNPYFPTLDGLFMGVSRTYRVLVTGTQDGARASINELVVKYYNDWEPLTGSFPQTVTATYGASNQVATYNADFEFYAYFDRATGYYIVPNKLGYIVLYDYENNCYIADLGINAKFDKLYEHLEADGIPIYQRVIRDLNFNEYFYVVDSEIFGWYILKNNNIRMMYNMAEDFYLIYSESQLNQARQILANNNADIRFVVSTISVASGGNVTEYDTTHEFTSGLRLVSTNLGFPVLYAYDPLTNSSRFYVEFQHEMSSALNLFPASVTVNTDINWQIIDFNGEKWDNSDWVDARFWAIEHKTEFSWEDMTLEGGLFIVEVIIGKGMMATYRELVRALVLNRTIVPIGMASILIENPEAEGGYERVLVPVIDSVTVDPYAFTLLRADYENNLRIPREYQPELLNNFVRWFFSFYVVSMHFTVIYDDPAYDTRSEIRAHLWDFEVYNKDKSAYKESDINNAGNFTSITYVVAYFHGQRIALQIIVPPRTIAVADSGDSKIMFAGEKRFGEYTVDALLEETYKLPQKPTIYFTQRDSDGYELTLNLNDFSRSASTVFASLPAGLNMSRNSIGLHSLVSCVISDCYQCDRGMGVNYPVRSDSINWSNPVADNVYLAGNDGKPFLTSGTNTTTAFFDLKNHVDPLGIWFSDVWRNPLLRLSVFVPDKIVGKIDVSHGGAVLPDKASNLTVGNESKRGVHYVNPYDMSTWEIPTDLTVYFNPAEAGDPYDAKNYEISWKLEDESGNAYDFIEYRNGRFYATQNFIASSDSFTHRVLRAVIGNEGALSPDGGAMFIVLEVVLIKESAVVENFAYLAKDGTHIMLSAGLGFDNSALLAPPFYQYDPANPEKVSHIYEVDTHHRFEIPSFVRVKFNDGTVRIFSAKWTNPESPFAPNSINTILTTIGNPFFSAEIPLTIHVANRAGNYIEEIELRDNTDDNLLGKHGIDYIVNHDAKRIDISGVVFTNDRINGLSPYQFFMFLFSNVYVKLTPQILSGGYDTNFDSLIGTETVMKDLMLWNDDHRYSAFWQTLLTFDSQKMIEDFLGQRLIIYFGQGAGADDYTVYFHATGIPVLEGGAIEEITVFPFDPATGASNYEDGDGFVFARDIELNIKYFGQDLSLVQTPEVWYVGAPEGIDAVTSGSVIPAGTALTMITKDELVAIGRYIWITTMLSDSSRVYRKINIEGVMLDLFNSVADINDPNNPLVIRNSTIVIDNIYAVLWAIRNISNDSIPKNIRFAGSEATIRVLNWNLNAETAGLLRNSVNYLTNWQDEPRLLATAEIFGETLKLFVVILPTEIGGIGLHSAVDSTRSFESELDEDGVIAVYIDAYHNRGYNGNFTLPLNNLRLFFIDPNSNNNQLYNDPWIYNGATYQSVALGINITAIRYNYSGIIGDLENGISRVTVTFTMPCGLQTVTVRFNFPPKIVSEISVENPIDSLNRGRGEYEIDPYSARILNHEVTVYFQDEAIGGYYKPYEYTVPQWIVPSDYELLYNTYDKVLKERVNDYFALTANLLGGSPSANQISAQTLNLKVFVVDRLYTDWRFRSQSAGLTLADTLISDSDNPNALYHYTNPFEGRANDMPHDIFGTNGGIANTTYPVSWEFYDENIHSNGTNGFRLVRGTVYGQGGQQVTIRVYIDNWGITAISRVVNGSPIIIDSSDYRFFFRPDDGLCNDLVFQVRMRKLRYDITKGTLMDAIFEAELFYAHASDAPAHRKDYLMRWDSQALLTASQGNMTQATGRVALMDADGREKLLITTQGVYQYETMRINHINLGFGGTTAQPINGGGIAGNPVFAEYNVLYVVNPLNINFALTTVEAFGERHGVLNQSLGTATINWNGNYGTGYWDNPRNREQYLTGGIFNGYRIELTLNFQFNTYEPQGFRIMLVFLDMSPEPTVIHSGYTIDNIPFISQGMPKITYHAETYLGVANSPYIVNYSAPVIDALNLARSTLLSPTYQVSIQIISWRDNEFPPNPITTRRLVRSRTVSINGIVYNSGIASLQFVP
ncbi:MAG: hypothetical protein FWD49_00030 [Firmicutes bacterium]|nr:hypothetical protein [Bacillota bacterium]